MIIRGDYYGWKDDHILLDIARDRIDRTNFSDPEIKPKLEVSEIGILCLRSFLNNLQETGNGDQDYSLALAKAFLVSVAA